MAIDAGGGLVGALPGATRQAGRVDVHRLVVPLARVVAQPAGDRAGPNGNTDIFQEGQEGGLAEIGPVTQGLDQCPQMGAKLPTIAVGEWGGDRRSAAGNEPDLAHKADALRLEHQILDDDRGGAVPDGVRGKGFRVNHTALRAGHRQGRVFLGRTTWGWGATLNLGGVVGGRRWHGRCDRRLGRAALQARVLITQLLNLGAQGRVLGHQRLDQVQELPHELARRGVRDGLQVNVRDLHMGVVYQTSAAPSPGTPGIMERIPFGYVIL